MAKENLSILYGYLNDKPKIYTDKEGNLKKALFSLTVIRRFNTLNLNVTNNIRYDCVLVKTSNVEHIKEIAKLKSKDMVFVKGVLATLNVKKITRCPNCNKEHISIGSQVYVEPIFIETRERNVQENEYISLLQNNNEISNILVCIGTLCREPAYYRDEETGFNTIRYQLAVNRKYRVLEDPAEKTTDYPWVKSFGNQAVKDCEKLHISSKILIDGCLQAREFLRKTECECGEEYEWQDNTIEIVPYSIEYLSNCNMTEEEIQEEMINLQNAILAVKDEE